MSDYCHKRVIRMKISEEEACEIFGVDDGCADVEAYLKVCLALKITNGNRRG